MRLYRENFSVGKPAFLEEADASKNNCKKPEPVNR